MAVDKAVTIVVYAVGAELEGVLAFFSWCALWNALLAPEIFAVDIAVTVIVHTVCASLLRLFLVFAAHGDVTAVEAAEVFAVDIAIAVRALAPIAAAVVDLSTTISLLS